MPDPNQKNPSSAHGQWFVDQSLCQGCRLCLSLAHKNIKLDEDERAYFFKQPKGDQEHTDCQRALEQCPELAVGKEDDPKSKPGSQARH